MEFRGNVRKLLPKADVKEIDALYDTMDDDRSGALEVAEVRVAFKRFAEAAAGLCRRNAQPSVTPIGRHSQYSLRTDFGLRRHRCAAETPTSSNLAAAAASLPPRRAPSRRAA